jgi:hypothetical protein
MPAELALALGLPPLDVARLGLGTLNHTTDGRGRARTGPAGRVVVRHERGLTSPSAPT